MQPLEQRRNSKRKKTVRVEKFDTGIAHRKMINILVRDPSSGKIPVDPCVIYHHQPLRFKSLLLG